MKKDLLTTSVATYCAKKTLATAIVCSGLAIASVHVYAQNQSLSVPADGGGTLSLQVNTDIEPCSGAHGFESNIQTASYSKASYTDGSGTTQLSGPIALSAVINGCNPKSTKVAQYTYKVSPYISVNFTGDGGGSASAVATTQSAIDPAYKVVSILYATPGDSSSSSFTNSTTTGTNTTIGSSFTEGVSETFGLGFIGIGGSLTLGTSSTTGNSSSFTETITNGAATTNASGGSINTRNHNQDLILVWLNPEVNLTQVGFNINYSIGVQSLNGNAAPADVIPVLASSMEDNPSHQSHVPLGLLEPQSNGTPGLAKICAKLNVAEYQSLSCTMEDQCGCTSYDFAPIVATDPLLNVNPSQDTTTAYNPMNVDGSGGPNCLSPQSGDDCRYVVVPASAGSQSQQTTLLEGPVVQGGDHPINAFTQSDATTTTKTLSGSSARTVAYTTKIGFPLIGSITNANTWTWTDNQSVGATNGTANQIGYSLSTDTVNCAEGILIFEDTIFHTFVAQQSPGNSTCP